jgi:hypothetical protein
MEGLGAVKSAPHYPAPHYPAQHYPRWFTPLRLLLLFTYAMLLVWMDQGTFSSASVMVSRLCLVGLVEFAALLSVSSAERWAP